MMRACSSPKKHWLVILLGLVVLLRLFTLGMYPLMDTTEARYAEIARKMVELGDWITPWFDYGVPFWGKPPLSFWATALSFKLFGINEFAARLPHCLLGISTAWLVWKTAAQRSSREALYAVILLGSAILFYLASGMVMTDMVLALSVTIAMRGCWLSIYGLPEQKSWQRWLVFVGLGLGMLAKGPVALVMIGGPIVLWAMVSKQSTVVWRELPWIRGSLLTAVIALPWYILAEQRTPGFLDYFILGEHWHRFITPGWTGDLYGSAHQYPRGTIWWFAFADWFPWSVLLPILALLCRKDMRPATSTDPKEREWLFYLLCWGLMPCVFFTMARNILWAYVLPGMPAIALWIASYLSRFPTEKVEKVLLTGLVLTGLGCVGILINVSVVNRGQHKSAKSLVSAYQLKRNDNEALVMFGGERVYSAAFYSQGKVERVSNVDQLLCRLQAGPAMVAIENQKIKYLPDVTERLLQPVGQYGAFTLFVSKERRAQSPHGTSTNNQVTFSQMAKEKLPCSSGSPPRAKEF